jgi:hypothetical protein
VKLFGSTNSAHCFIYADYSVSSAEVKAELAHPTRRFLGYHTFTRIQLVEQDLSPRGWTRHVEPGELPANAYAFSGIEPYGFLEVLDRDDGLDEAHGARRLGVMFLGADGVATYDALFCQADGTPAPYATVVVDHGFGGNYDRFGRGGLLERIAKRCRCSPQYLLVAENTLSWEGYDRIPDLDGDRGGMHGELRFLHRRT